MSVFGDAKLVKTLKEGFICVAVNQHHHRRRKDLEYDLFEKLVHQTGEKVSGQNQGLYFFTPSAQLLSFSNTLSNERAWKLLRKATKKFTPPGSLPAVLKGHEKAGPLWKGPEGSQVVLVTTKVLDGYEETKNQGRRIQQQSLGREHLWLSSEEIAALAKDKFPESLRKRLPRVLYDNTRGESGRWGKNQVKQLDLNLKDGRLTGHAHFESAKGDRGFKADVLGFVATEKGRLTRFDIIVKGTYWGEARFARNAPEGKFPFAVSLRLSEGDKAYDTPPPGVR